MQNAAVSCLQVKDYLERQWYKILTNRVSVQDFTFAKEVRMGTYSPKLGVMPAAAVVAAKAMQKDPRAEPRHLERVPYVVCYGPPGGNLGCAEMGDASKGCPVEGPPNRGRLLHC